MKLEVDYDYKDSAMLIYVEGHKERGMKIEFTGIDKTKVGGDIALIVRMIVRVINMVIENVGV